jgi:hypothetical protein
MTVFMPGAQNRVLIWIRSQRPLSHSFFGSFASAGRRPMAGINGWD